MTSYLIIGAGRFGLLAWQRLRKREPAAQFWVVDQDPAKLAQLPDGADTWRQAAGGAALLAQVLTTAVWPDWVIPAIPLHLAFAWLQLTLPSPEAWRPVPVPQDFGQAVPSRHWGEEGEVYLSLATGRCPDDCSEPADRCALTKAPRIGNLFEMLARQQLPGYKTLVLRSRQLAPGVGGYRPAALLQLRQEVLQAAAHRLIICTACRCHGVCHGLERLIGRESEVGI
ncbi:MAG: hypothetical protein ACUVRZ_01535 [Desulfobacca sp.]|uniref:hypothetical protein n=1 Tax=Desulfobacca sp. TaxID=2067990 RepID=UPI00404AF195